MDIVSYATAVYNGIKEEQEAIADALARGAALDMKQYKHMVGRIDGLELARSIAKQALEKYTDDE